MGICRCSSDTDGEHDRRASGVLDGSDSAQALSLKQFVCRMMYTFSSLPLLSRRGPKSSLRDSALDCRADDVYRFEFVFVDPKPFDLTAEKST